MPRKPDPKDRRHFYPRPDAKASDGLWLYGLHTVRAALANPRRKVKRAVLTARAGAEIGAKLLGRVRHETVELDAVTRLLPAGAVHQGAALQCEPLPGIKLEDALKPSPRRRIVLVLDQITDPHNEGAILRTAAAFGVSAVIVQDRHTPPETGVLAKAASGALDIVPLCQRGEHRPHAGRTRQARFLAHRADRRRRRRAQGCGGNRRCRAGARLGRLGHSPIGARALRCGRFGADR